MLHFFTIFTKTRKVQVLSFGSSYKDRLCPKLLKKHYLAKIGPTKCFMLCFMPILRSYKSIKSCNFWLKLAPKSHLRSQGVIYHWNICFHNTNLPQHTISDQSMTYAQIYEHPFKFILPNNKNLIAVTNPINEMKPIIAMFSRDYKLHHNNWKKSFFKASIW